jgi:hypothetical protein
MNNNSNRKWIPETKRCYCYYEMVGRKRILVECENCKNNNQDDNENNNN